MNLRSGQDRIRAGLTEKGGILSLSSTGHVLALIVYACRGLRMPRSC